MIDRPIEIPARLQDGPLRDRWPEVLRAVLQACTDPSPLPPVPSSPRAKCRWCPGSFDSAESLNRHVGQKHPGKAQR